MTSNFELFESEIAYTLCGDLRDRLHSLALRNAEREAPRFEVVVPDAYWDGELTDDDFDDDFPF